MSEQNPAVDVNILIQKEKRRNNKFSSTLGSYVVQLGHSLGMSDIWKFPFLTYRNGGGAFLIPFVTMVVVCGIPMYFLEYSVGKFSGRGPYQVWDICPLLRGVGLTICLTYGVYMIGQSIFRCWIIQFIIYAFRNPIPWSHCDNEWNTPICKDNKALVSNGNVTQLLLLLLSNATHGAMLNSSMALFSTRRNVSSSMSIEYMSAAEEFWQFKVLQLSSGISDFSPVIWYYCLFLFLFRVAICLCNIKSMKSIEKVIYVTAAVPIVITVAIFIRSIMLPGYQLGLYYFFYPEFDKLLNIRVWIEATLMAFFTLSFGWGAVVLIGSHADFKENCLRTAVVLPLIDMSVAVFNGMVCFCVLGNMAHSYNVNMTDVISAGMATGMVSYITALSAFPFPQLWSVIFFVSLLLVGLEGQLIPFDMLVQLIGDLFPRSMSAHKMKILVALTCVMFIFALPTCTGAGCYIFLWVDWYIGAWFGPIVAFVEVTVVAWIYGLDRFNDDVHVMIGRNIPVIMRIVLAFVTPALVAVVFFASLVKYVPPKYGTYSYPTSARILGWLLVSGIVMPIIVQAIHIIRKQKAPYLSNVSKLLNPLDTWGPGEETKQVEYHSIKSKYHNRRFSDLLYYNFFGKYRETSAISVVENKELDRLQTE